MTTLSQRGRNNRIRGTQLEPWVISIPWLGESTNKIYAGMHWRKRKEIADTGHTATLVAIWGASETQGALPHYPVHITFTPYGGRKRDIDNYSFTVKVIIDGLVKAGVLTDDTDEYVSGVTILAHVPSKEKFMRVEVR